MAAVYDSARGVLRMTMDDWKRTHKDYKGTGRDATGARYRTALHNVPGQGTCLVPVEIIPATPLLVTRTRHALGTLLRDALEARGLAVLITHDDDGRLRYEIAGERLTPGEAADRLGVVWRT